MLIEVLDKIAIDKLTKKQEISNYQQVNCSIGNDEKIYLLFAEKTSERINGMFVPTTSNTKYKALVLTVDWYNNGKWGTELLDFGTIKQNIHYLQPIGENYLLVGARTKAKDNNALIVDKYKNIIKQFYLADAIEQCIVDKQNNIITSYFDEGVFGNEPISASGLVKWSENGKVIWQNSKYDIFDCYAINIDEKNNLWFYYYTEFLLVKTNYINDETYQPDISGCSNFLFNQSQTAILFDKGYSKHNKFCVKNFTFKNHSLTNGKDAYFTYKNKKILPQYVKFRSTKAVLLDKQNNLYYTNWL